MHRVPNTGTSALKSRGGAYHHSLAASATQFRVQVRAQMLQPYEGQSRSHLRTLNAVGRISPRGRSARACLLRVCHYRVVSQRLDVGGARVGVWYIDLLRKESSQVERANRDRA